MSDLDSRPHVCFREKYVGKNPPSEEELIAQEEQIAAEGDNGTYVPELTVEDELDLRQLETKNFTLDELKERVEREDLVGRLAAGALCEMAFLGKDWALRSPDTIHGRSAWAELEKAIPKLSEICGRKVQPRPRRK